MNEEIRDLISKYYIACEEYKKNAKNKDIDTQIKYFVPRARALENLCNKIRETLGIRRPNDNIVAWYAPYIIPEWDAKTPWFSTFNSKEDIEVRVREILQSNNVQESSPIPSIIIEDTVKDASKKIIEEVEDYNINLDKTKEQISWVF